MQALQGSLPGRGEGEQDERQEAAGQARSLKDIYMDVVNSERALSIDKLNSHVIRKHPKKFDLFEDEFVNWSIWEDVGSLSE